MNKRLFVRKKEAYRIEEKQLLQTLKEELELNVLTLAVYDVFHIDEHTLQQAKQFVFSEVMIDDIIEQVELKECCYFAYESLPSQYDQRADSAMQCITLLNNHSNCVVRSGKLIVFEQPLSQSQLKQIEQLLVNPIDTRIKNMNVLSLEQNVVVKPLYDLSGFMNGDHQFLLNIKKQLSLALDLEDLVFIQRYFKSENREPTETEIYVLDCYWSDHCRHTTFETILTDIQIQSTLFQKEIEMALEQYLRYKEMCSPKRPITLMDMASVVGKYHRNILKDENIEMSEEVNACSFFTTIMNNHQPEKWLIQFKNETHNHPTEIEPFGGASTCIGGAIRDPLSGRSFVYQAMRISGCGNVLQKRTETLPYKLPQKQIARNAAKGYSSYGNQIGLATTFVKEIYDESYVAKHLEAGAVVGAVRHDLYQRQSTQKGDIVVVIGGRTGRDGIQGASGSSLVHSNDSLAQSSSQVQKGNAIEERKIQRLFRNSKVSKMIKKCNDFGAGGVCVAIGELASGIEIHLDNMLLKYQGLNATEIAISESQERMAVVIDPQHYTDFVKACEEENIEYSHVATITDRNRLEMYFGDEKVVDMSSEFLSTSGVQQHNNVVIEDNLKRNPFEVKPFNSDEAMNELKRLNVTSQKGLITMFDASIGNTTVLMPLTGKNQLTPTQASVQALPTLYSTSDTATILSYGFIPEIAYYSPFLSAVYSVLLSVAKVYAVGGNKENLYFSFQEYFEKLGKDDVKWGKVTQSLLGTIYAQHVIGRPSIGGKDSMSGTFNELNVVETLLSFACTPVQIEHVITPELKTIGNYLYYIPLIKDEKHFPDILKMMESYETIHHLIKNKKIVSAYVQEEGSVFSSLVKMALGNDIGFDVNLEHLNFEPGSMIVESTEELPFVKLGVVSNEVKVNQTLLDISQLYQCYTETLNSVYPIETNSEKGKCESIVTTHSEKKYFDEHIETVKVVIPVFPGTNCEYDSANAFIQEGAIVETVVIKNKKPTDIEQSIDALVDAIQTSHIICFAGGFSSVDEPDGSAKFIVNVLHNEKVKNAIHQHLKDKKLILGICNGFQALLKSGLLPYGEIKALSQDDLTLYRNDCNHHISRSAFTRVANTNSPWTQFFDSGTMHEVLFSHGEGKVMGNAIEKFKHLAAFQYCDFDGQATLNGRFNPNGSLYAIEGLVSEDGLILGKMGHSERYHSTLYKTRTLKDPQNIFRNGVMYFKKGGKYAKSE